MCAAVRGIVTRALLGWLEQRALAAAAAERPARSRSTDGAPAARREPQFAARSGAVIFAQRFGSALNLNLHFHALLLDGAFVSPSERLAPHFQPAAPLSDADVAELVEQLARRITRYLERQGRLTRAHSPADADEPAEHDTSLFDQLCAASVQGGAALAPESSPPLARLGQRRPPRPPPLPGSLCADRDGFSLHAKVLVPAGELERLEHLCRYVTRPPIATQRLVLAPDGRVIYGLKRHWRDGTSAVSFDPLTFIERLAAGSSSQRRQGVVAIRRCATNRGLPSTPTRPSTHLPRRARAGLRLARPRRPQARARIHFALLRPARSQLAGRAQHLRPLALVALDVGRTLAPRLRPRRPHLPALRRPAPPHSAAHRPSRRAQDPRAPRPPDRASTAHTGSLTRTVRLRLSRRPLPAEHAPRPRSAPPSRPGRIQNARTTAPARVERLASPAPRPDLGSGGDLTDRPAAANLPCAVNDGRLRRRSSAWNSYPPRLRLLL